MAEPIALKLCVCTACIMNGATEILTAVEHIQQLETQLGLIPSLEITTYIHHDAQDHHTMGPMVQIGGIPYQKATPQLVLRQLMPPAETTTPQL